MIPLVDVLTRTEGYLRSRGIPSPRYEAEQLLAHALEIQRLQIYLQHDRPMSDEELALLRPLVARRGKREPLAWILGTVGFHALELQVTPGVLVPRPDTETLVDEVLARIPEGETDPVYIADVGCGSGAIGLAVATARENARVFSIDIADAPLACTRANVAALGLEKRVAVLKGNLLDPIPPNRVIDWVVSNPPYIPSKDLTECEPEVSQWEPKGALDGGRDGLAVYQQLLPTAVERARKGVLVEVGIRQAPHIKRLMLELGLVDVTTANDLGGVVRVVAGHKPS
ncbi:MAG: peptide chain release factor N(5)-glutamine methyltransferase [Proteobacteria bacterium]|nr:peptide chain release factor N(5)-glutamine methyltransferase [Pseudomonadota bacterium]